jgi:hypothetical protein
VPSHAPELSVAGGGFTPQQVYLSDPLLMLSKKMTVLFMVHADAPVSFKIWLKKTIPVPPRININLEPSLSTVCLLPYISQLLVPLCEAP